MNQSDEESEEREGEEREYFNTPHGKVFKTTVSRERWMEILNAADLHNRSSEEGKSSNSTEKEEGE